MGGSAKGVLASNLVNIILVALVVFVLILIFYFIITQFGGGQYCLGRFQGELGRLVNDAATTFGSAVTYTSFKVEDCVTGAYFKPDTRQYCYTYKDDGKERCDSTVFRPLGGTSTPVAFTNCGTSGSGMQPGTYTVKVTARTVCCGSC